MKHKCKLKLLMVITNQEMRKNIMTVKNVCEKSISCMGNKIIRYSICKNLIGGTAHYGIQLSESSKNLNQEESIENISPNKDFVYDLIKYLYENVIDVTHFKDIVEDYILMCEKV